MADNTTVRLDRENVVQPDALLIVDPAAGGQSRVGGDGYLEGIPELVAEIAASSVSIDRHAKQRVYRRNAVREYIVWRTQDHAIDWFTLHQSEYVPLALDERGLYRSVRFPGLWLDPAAMIRFDLATVQRFALEGIASPEHAAFVTSVSVL